MFRELAFLCFLLFLPFCTLGPPPSHPSVKAASYLRSQLNPALDLLREFPETAPDVHWLLTDNQLAVWSLDAAGDASFSAALQTAIDAHSPPPHCLIEALRGEVVFWPPRTPVQVEVADGVWLETRSGEGIMYDWTEYADLALYGSMNATNKGDNEAARRLFDDALRLFDGYGFKDKAHDGRYTTYNLALAVIAAKRIGVEPDPRLLPALLVQQASSGGFFAHSTAEEGRVTPVGDTNTETTAYALLALGAGLSR